jgi:hypothetical protein
MDAVEVPGKIDSVEVAAVEVPGKIDSVEVARKIGSVEVAVV